MLEHIITRNAELMHAIRSEIGRADVSETLAIIVKRALAHPAPRYYVSYAVALNAMSRALAGKRVCKSPLREAMWREIAGKVQGRLDRGAPSIAIALSEVLAREKASGFFISPARALSIYHEEVRASIRSIIENRRLRVA